MYKSRFMSLFSWFVLPIAVILLRKYALLMPVLHAMVWTTVRLLQIVMLVVGGGSFWWMLRSYQLQVEQELYDHALLKYHHSQRYQYRTSSGQKSSYTGAGMNAGGMGGYVDSSFGGMLDAGFQLRVLKRLPIDAHLRTSWCLPQEICDEIALFVDLAVRDYVLFWFQPISRNNEEFPNDVKFLLADLIGALVSRILEVDSSQALTVMAKSIELLRLHLAWFRETYAQLAEEYPRIFEGQENDANLLKRQEYVAALAQKSPLLHPGCVLSPSSSSTTSSNSTTNPINSYSAWVNPKKSSPEPAEIIYLRHVATQLLMQLKPQLGQQYDTNVFVSIAMNLMRESVLFKILKPLAEYSQSRYANEMVVSMLQQTMLDAEKDSPASPTTAAALSAAMANSGSRIPTLSLNKLRATKSFLYKASKRSGVTAEAAFQAVVEAVTSAASTAVGAAEVVFDGEDWTDAASLAFNSGLYSSNSSHSTGQEKKALPFASLFSLDERMSLQKGSKRINSRGFILSSTSSSSMKSAESNVSTSNSTNTTHMEDLKSIKNNIGSSLNNSLGKVKKRFRTLSGHPNDPLATPNPSASTSQAAARIMKKPGMLLQKALRRSETGGGASSGVGAMSPTASFDDPLTPPPPDSLTPPLSGVIVDTPPRPDSRTRSYALSADLDEPSSDNIEDEPNVAQTQTEGVDRDTIMKVTHVQERVVLLLEKTVSNYLKMYREQTEMRSSARSRELYELLSALEDILMLGYREKRRGNGGINGNGTGTPPSSPGFGRRTTMPLLEDEVLSQSPIAASDDSMDFGSVNNAEFEDDYDPNYYWNYLAQDRPSASLLNDHWRFVGFQCPQCRESDSFYSTRGVQWILVALERGILWDCFNGLHAHKDVTVDYYDEATAVMRNSKLMVNVLNSLQPLKKLVVALEIPLILGRPSEMQQEFGILSPSSAKRMGASSSNDAVRVLESVWEVERYVPIHGWTKAQDKRRQELPSSEWIWEGDWTLEIQNTGESSDGETGNSWEYAKTFEDRFHGKEKKFDSVRRRKWIRRRRQLPLVLTLVSGSSVLSPTASAVASTLSPTSSTNRSSPSSTSVPSSNKKRIGKIRALRQRFDALDREKRGSATGSPLFGSPRKALVKRRSLSLDKASPECPLPDLDLLLLSPRKEGKEPSSQGSMNKPPLLRRSSSGSSELMKDVKHTLATSRSLVSGSGEERSLLSDSIYDEDDNNLCFRCLKPLISSSSKRGSSSNTCQSCHQRVCESCHNFFAFLVFPPPLESSKKAQVCGSCYERLVSRYKLRIEAHVGKYLIKDKADKEPPDLFGSLSQSSSSNPAQVITTTDSITHLDSSLSTSATAGSSSSNKFEITVYVKGEASFAWSVVKTFHDFEVLEKKLYDKMKKQEKKHGAGCHACHWKGVDYMEVLTIEPCLKKLPIPALSYEKRLYVLEEFLQNLLNCYTLCQSPVVQKFLLVANASSAHGATATMSADPFLMLSGAESGSPDTPAPLQSNNAMNGSGSSTSSTSQNAYGQLMENGKWRRGRWIAPETNTKETKMRILQKIEVSLFSVLSEMFEFDGISMVRRHLFSMTRSFIKAFLNASHFRMLERKYLSFTDPKEMTGMIQSLRLYMFPEDPDAVTTAPASLTFAEMQALRKDCLEAILSSFPSTVVSIFGETASENAALKVHEFLQHEIFVKNLLFSIFDEVQVHLFPDIMVFKGKRPQAPPSPQK